MKRGVLNLNGSWRYLRQLLPVAAVACGTCLLQAQTPGATPAVPIVGPNAPPVPKEGDPLFAPVAKPYDPQTVRQKFMDYAVLTFGPRAFFPPLMLAAVNMVDPPNRFPREWRNGAAAFGRNYGDGLAFATAADTGRFLTGAMFHEDFRYRPSTSKNKLRRTFHALAYTFVDKSDSGHSQLAFANFVSAGAGGFVGTLYLPPGFNDLSHAQARMAFVFGGYALQNLAREFAPDLLKSSKKRRLPFPRIPLPEWWVPR